MFDYHMHSKYSCDGREEITTLCLQSIRRGLTEIAITDHYELFLDHTREDVLDFENLYKDILQARELYEDKVRIKFGLELGQAHFNLPLATQVLSKYPFDFIIGSVHNLDDNSDMAFVDYSATPISVLFDNYLDALINMVQQADFDVVGHITYPIRYAFASKGVYPNWTPFKPKLEYLYKELIKRDKGIEINCSGFFQALKRPMPDLELLTFYKECGGKILTLGCDSHVKRHVGSTVSQGLEVIKAAGFCELASYSDRVPSLVKF
ncbi:MAG: hypothetical protein BEN18_09620 [Epulopiscium sp. Nuni2H_MBin001]|nr:MAG: hypothetical protein BEN18_09620 [Epulopiscium sp. Nuni2H_MBin001]